MFRLALNHKASKADTPVNPVHIADTDGKRVASSLVCACKSIIFFLEISFEASVLSELELGQKDEIDSFVSQSLKRVNSQRSPRAGAHKCVVQ